MQCLVNCFVLKRNRPPGQLTTIECGSDETNTGLGFLMLGKATYRHLLSTLKRSRTNSTIPAPFKTGVLSITFRQAICAAIVEEHV